jgi:hypothetical protein
LPYNKKLCQEHSNLFSSDATNFPEKLIESGIIHGPDEAIDHFPFLDHKDGGHAWDLHALRDFLMFVDIDLDEHSFPLQPFHALHESWEQGFAGPAPGGEKVNNNGDIFTGQGCFPMGVVSALKDHTVNFWLNHFRLIRKKSSCCQNLMSPKNCAFGFLGLESQRRRFLGQILGERPNAACSKASYNFAKHFFGYLLGI